MHELVIPVNGKVVCTDGSEGFVSTVVVDPVQRVLTHVVVKTSRDTDHLVPLAVIDNADEETVYLNCTVAELESMPTFTELHYIKMDYHDYSMYQSGAYQAPYVSNIEEDHVPVAEEQVPPGELAVHRGTKVAATDGNVGELEEFAIDPSTGKVTHFILRKGHLWGKREITIPISAIERMEENTVHLNISKKDIEALPAIKVKRH